MADIAQLGFMVNTSGLALGKSAMGAYAEKGRKTEKEINRSVTGMNTSFMSLSKTIGIVGVSLLALTSARGLSNIIAYADEWKNVNSQIKQVTGSSVELASVQKQLFNLAQETRSELGATVNLYTEITRSTKDLNLAAGKQIEIVRTLNNLFVAGGKPISEVSGAIRQLSQGFASGVLRGDEFNSVAEGAPRIMDALTRALQMTRGELREFAATGGITAKIMVDALSDYSRTAQKLADQTEKTFGQSFQIATNNTIKFIGESETLNNVVNKLGSAIEGASMNIGAFVDASATLVGIVGLGLVPLMVSYTSALVLSTSATVALTAASRFLLGPWGLLITAIGFAANVFINTAEASKRLREENEASAKTIDKLTAKYDKFSTARLGAISIKAQEKAIELERQRLDLEEKLLKVKKSLEGSAAIFRVTDALEETNKKLRVQEGILEAVGRAFESNMPNLTAVKNITSGFDKLTVSQMKLKESFEKQMLALVDQTIQLKLTSDEYEIYSQRQLAIANKSTPEMIASIEAVIRTNQKLRDDLSSRDEQKDLINESKLAILEQVEAIKLQSKELALGADAFELYIVRTNLIASKAAPELVSAMLDIVKANQKLSKEMDSNKDLNLSMSELTDQVDEFGGAWTRTGSIIVDTFGDISDSVNSYIGEIKTLDKLQENIDQNRKKEGADQLQLDRLQEKVNINRINAELGGIKSLSMAGQSLFEDKTAASKAFAALSQAITIAEIAMSFQKMAASTTETGVHVVNETTKQGANALTAITSAFAAPFPIGPIAGASMIAVMASLLGSAFGGGGVKDPTAARQASQGTGTVLGSTDKSSSIFKSQERYIEVNIDQLSELRRIKSSLDSMAEGIGRLSTSIAGGGLGAFSGKVGSSGSSSGSLISGLLGKTTKKVVDEGIVFVSQSLGSIISKGIVNAEAFFSVETKKSSFFGLVSSKKLSIETQGIDSAITTQMAGIFSHIGDTVLQSAESLGFETIEVISRSVSNVFSESGKFKDFIVDGFETVFETSELSLKDALSKFNVNIGKISLEGLSGQEIEQELQAVFSKQADLIAEFLVPGIAKYQRISEGLFDTLTRVTQEQAIFNDAIKLMGFDLSEVSNVIQIDVAQSIITLTGGLEAFSSATTSFIDNFFSDAEKFNILQESLTEAFADLGVPMVDTTEGFRDLIASLDPLNAADQELLAVLLLLSPALAEYIEGLEDLEEQQAEALKVQQDSARVAFSILEDSIDLEKQRVQAVFDMAKETHKIELDRIAQLRESLNKENELRKGNLLEAESGLRASFNKEMQQIRDNASIRIKSLNDEAAAISNTSSAMKSLVSSINSSLGTSGNASLVSALSSAMRGDFRQAQNLNIGALTTLDPSSFSSAEDLAIQQALNQNRLETISDLASKQLTESEIAISAINREIESIENTSSNEISALENQLKTLLNIDDSVLSVADAIETFKTEQQSLNELNFNVEIKKLDMLISSAEDVFDLHEDAYNQELERLDLILASNLELLNAALEINNSILTIPEAIAELQTSIEAIPPAPVVTEPKDSGGQARDLKKEIIAMKEESTAFQLEIVKNTKSTAEILRRFEYDGIDTRSI